MIKLTLRRGVGAIYIDGLNFWNPEAYQDGETCVLESTVGLFSSKPPPSTAAVGIGAAGRLFLVGCVRDQLTKAIDTAGREGER